jgi:MFS family permease
MLCPISVLMSRLSSILATNTLTLVFIFKVGFTQIAALTGYFLLGVGCCAWITSASARIYGKRHTYVLGSILLLTGSIWGAVGTIPVLEGRLIPANDYGSLLGARIMQGFGTGPFEMLVPSSIGDMYLPYFGQGSWIGTLCISGEVGLRFKRWLCLAYHSSRQSSPASSPIDSTPLITLI